MTPDRISSGAMRRFVMAGGAGHDFEAVVAGISALILKFPQNREFNREFFRIRGFFGPYGGNSSCHFNALSGNSMRCTKTADFCRNFSALQPNSLMWTEQGIFSPRTGNSSVGSGNSNSLIGFAETIRSKIDSAQSIESRHATRAVPHSEGICETFPIPLGTLRDWNTARAARSKRLTLSVSLPA
jgi:hypothetical protein